MAPANLYTSVIVVPAFVEASVSHLASLPATNRACKFVFRIKECPQGSSWTNLAQWFQTDDS
jgi:hypothetical protein